MCLLVMIHRSHPDARLVVAANRDEWLERPALPMGLLDARSPRILGGRDQLAYGTWLAIGEHGVIAGLTNKPGGRDPNKKSRGELPLLLARHRTAETGVETFCREVKSGDYNPCWILVGDRDHLYFVDVTTEERPTARALPPGTHVLENRALGMPSPKAEMVANALADVGSWRGSTLVQGLAGVLRSHVIPEGAGEDDERPPQTEAACVHAGPYGTRCSTIVWVPDSPSEIPEVWHTDQAPCAAEHQIVSHLWR